MKKLLFLILACILLTSCEEDIEIKPNEGKDLIVVEGHIEPFIPPYVILTKSQTFFSSTSLDEISNMFVRGAEVTVSDGTQTVTLHEFSTDSIPDEILDTISNRLGIQFASETNPEGLRASIYTTLEMIGEVGRTYDLKIKGEGQELSSTTTIPEAAPLDSVWTVPHPTDDTLVTLYIRYSDPVGSRNYVRYFTSVNNEMFQPPYFTSVFDDRNLFNVDGKTLDFPLEQGHGQYEDIDFENYTYFTKGDSIVLRWCAIDEDHFNFWNTAEYSRASAGNPFSTPVKINSNIEGGLGIWGGYNPLYYYLIAE